MNRAANPRSSPDPALRRMERDTLLASAAMAIAALVVRGGRPDLAVGVVAGCALIAISYLAMKGGVDAVVSRLAPSADLAPARRLKKRHVVLLLVNFFIRYALLAVGAYVMLVHLRLHPVGLVAGVSSPVAAAALEVVRTLRRASRPVVPENDGKA